MNKKNIEFLERKLEENRVALAQARAEQARRKQRDDAKLFAHVGRAVCQVAKQSPDFHATVKQNIRSKLVVERFGSAPWRSTQPGASRCRSKCGC